MSNAEINVESYSGFGKAKPVEEGGMQANIEDVMGIGLAIETQNPIQIFYIGIGKDADMEVGRLLAEASGAEFQGVAEKDLAEVLEEYSKYLYIRD